MSLFVLDFMFWACINFTLYALRLNLKALKPTVPDSF